jgi:arylformamidase
MAPRKGAIAVILYDISMTIDEEMIVYKERAEKKPRLAVTRDFESGSIYETRLELDSHTGTHIDMPLHVFPDGAASDQWSAKNIFSRCVVLDFSALRSDHICAAALQQKEAEFSPDHKVLRLGLSVILKTKSSLQDSFDFSFVYLEKSGAAYLAEKGIRAVGIDALGIERDQPDHETHKILLGAGIWIIEGLRLAAVPEGEYILALMPLKIKGVEALPARAVLLDPASMTLP